MADKSVKVTEIFKTSYEASPEAKKRLDEKEVVKKRMLNLERFSVGTIYDLWEADFPKLEYYIPTLITEGHATVTFGQGGVGKTTLLLYFGLHIASGKATVFGETKQGNVLYIDEEIGVLGLKIKVLQIAEASGIKREDIKGHFFYRSMKDFKMDTEEGVELLSHEIEGKGIDVIIIDSLLACTVGDINNIDMRKIRDVTTLAYKKGVTIIFNHHESSKIVRKKGQKMTLGSLLGFSFIGYVIDDGFGMEKFDNGNLRIAQAKGRYIPKENYIDINVPLEGMTYGTPIPTLAVAKDLESKKMYHEIKPLIMEWMTEFPKVEYRTTEALKVFKEMGYKENSIRKALGSLDKLNHINLKWGFFKKGVVE